MNEIPFYTRQEVYKQALETFGAKNQAIVAIEELSELAKEVCKLLRDPKVTEYPRLAEELADATIMLEQLREIYGINDEVCTWMDFKVARLQERIMEAKKNGDS